MNYETKNIVDTTNFTRQIQTVARASAPVVITGATVLVSYQLALGATLILIASAAAFLITISILLYTEMRNQTEKLTQMHNVQIDDREVFKNEINRLDKKLFSGLSEEVPYGAFEIYLKYKSLSLSDFSDLIVCCSRIHTLVYAIANDVCQEKEIEEFFAENWDPFYKEKPYDLLYKQIEKNVSVRIRSRSEDNILISQIHTGESIKIEFKSGWLPSYKIDKGDIVIQIPKDIGGVLITGYLIAATINYGISVYNEGLESVKANLEIEKLHYEIDDFKQKSNSSQANGDLTIMLDDELRTLAINTIRNHEITSAKVIVGKPYKQV